jgi:hypothetical protein
MRRGLILVAILCLAVVAVPLVGAASATASDAVVAPPGQVKASRAETPALVPASGIWSWYGVEDFWGWNAILGDQLYAWDNGERGTWTGTFSGISYEPYSVMVDLATDNLWALITINFRGTVAGHRGTAVIGLTVDSPSPFGETMGGHWVVMSGTGGLRHLFGAGLWKFTGSDETHGYADYWGAYWLP